MLTCTRILASDLNIFISTGSKTREYKKVLSEEIEAQSLNYNIIEDISRSSEINAVISVSYTHLTLPTTPYV